MKKIVFTMIALMSLTVAMAQKSERKPHEEMTTQMESKLKLSADQKTKVAALNKEYQEIFQADNAKGQKTQEQKKAKRTEYDEKLKKILTDDQYKSYQGMQTKSQAQKKAKSKAKTKKKKTAKKNS